MRKRRSDGATKQPTDSGPGLRRAPVLARRLFRRAQTVRGGRSLPLTLVLVLAASQGGCEPAQPTFRLVCWAAPDGSPAPGLENRADAPSDDAGAAGFSRSPERAQLTAAINETVAFRLRVRYTGAAEGEVSVTVDDWQSGDATLGSDAVALYRVHAVRVPRWPGWHIRTVEPDRRREVVEDVLIPAGAPQGGLPARMSDGDTLSLWVDVKVPKGTRPGMFWSKLRLRCDGAPAAAIDLRLRVLPFVLPDQAEVVLAADVDQAALFAHHVTYEGRPCRAVRIPVDSPIRWELQSVLDATMRLLQAHKVTPLLSTLYPVVKIDASSEVTVRWEAYDRAVEGYLDGAKFIDRVPLPIWVIPFDAHFPAPPAYGTLQSPSYSRHLRRYLARCAEHFADRGWLERSFVEIPHAEFPSPETFEASAHFARVIRKADRRLRVLSNLFPQNLGAYGRPAFPGGDLLGYVDIWCPPAQFYDPAAATGALGRAPPARMWMQVDRPPFSGSIELAAAAADTRVLPWQAHRERAPVVRLGVINRWPGATEEVTAQACVGSSRRGPGEGAPLIYPGALAGMTEPIPSVRLKRLRRGMLDLAYLKLMRGKGLGHIAEVLGESLAPFAAARAYRYHWADTHRGGWIRDAYWWREARAIMADELTRALRGDHVDEGTGMDAAVRWRRFIESVRRRRIAAEGVRVRRVGPPLAHQGASIECTVVVHNQKRTSVSGSIEFGELPVAWSDVTGPAEVTALPGEWSRSVLAAEAPVITLEDGGARYLPIEFTAEDGEVHRIEARMSYVAALPVSDAIRIDGDLSDWPPGVGNLASDFVFITGEAPDGPHEARSRPTSKTRVYAAADAEALYFALDCATEGAAPEGAAHSNVLEYDDLIPVGEELVEIVLDPTGAGTHSPGDLYHVVIKPSGAIWERGIGAPGAPGTTERRRIWAADIRHATRTYHDRWVGEVRIPREAFGDQGSPPPAGGIWGVNFSRFDLKRQEYSNWAGAARNFYDPASLGNLALP